MKKMVKIIASGAICAAMCTVNVLAASFSDIHAEQYSWAKTYIEDMADKGLINGYEDGTFRPDNQVTKLECIALFARAMGALDNANASLLQKAHEEYDSILQTYDLGWGHDELAYMLYKGALTESDLNTYIRYVKDEPMLRYEAAIIITKAMAGDSEAKEQTKVSLDYTDAKDIPSNALGYVSFVTDKGIMNGMDDGGFAPNQSVLRSQMAVMLARVVDKTGYEYIEAKLTQIDTQNLTVILTDRYGAQTEYSYDENTQFKILGADVKPEHMLSNVTVSCTVQNGKLMSADSLTDTADLTVTGKYQGSATSGGVVTIRLTKLGENSSSTYICADDITVSYDGEPATLRSFKSGDVITLELSGGKVYAVKGEKQEYKIENAVISSVDIDEYLSVTISHSNSQYDGISLPVSDNATVQKNGVTTNFSDIYPGDRVTLTIKYGEIVSVIANSTLQTFEGTIQSINIANQSTMTVKINSVEKTYIIANDTPITKNGEDITVYDLRVGDTVKITTDSDAITKIVCLGSTISNDGRISGTVTAVNTSLGFVNVISEGNTVSETIFCNDTKTALISTLGTKKTMSTLKVGAKITAHGKVTNGAFVATLIVIEE